MLSQTREESKRWGGALGTNKPLEEGAMQKQEGKKESLKHARSSSDKGGKEKMFLLTSLLANWSRDEFGAGERSFSPAGRWLSSRQVRGCTGWGFLSDAA